MMDKLNILQWNIRSVSSNRGDLENCLLTKQINLAALSETWFNPNHTVRFSGYNIVRQDRSDARAGVAILIKNNIPFQILHNIHQIDGLMMVGISMVFEGNKISILSGYNPPNNNIPREEWVKFFESIPSPMIFCGDTNCHEYSWGNSFSDAKGRKLLEAIEDKNLVILNDGTPTLINNVYQYNSSSPDLTLCSPNIADRFLWSTLDDSLGSNHFPILIQSVSPSISSGRFIPSKIWNVGKADWNLFKSSLDVFASTDQIDDMGSYDKFLMDLNEACTIAVPKFSSHINPKFRKPWWNDDCSKIVSDRKKALKAYRHDPSFNNYIIYKKISALAKKVIKEAKRVSWLNFCNSLDKSTPPSTIWKSIKILKNREHTNHPPICIGPWVETFMNKLAPSFVQDNLFIENLETSNEAENFFMTPFSLTELNLALKPTANSAPGVDNVHYAMLYNLTYTYKMQLLNIFNKAWIEGNFPDEWRNYVVVPILKPEKNADCAESYRPISLSSCVYKTLERLIKNRLEWWIESNTKLPDSQYGFRRTRSTTDAQTQLLMDICLAFSANNTLLGLFLDITGAYDNVQLPILGYKMASIGLPARFIERIISFISDRKILLRINGTIVDKKITQLGLPQGSILSPILYSIYVSDIESILPDNVKIVQYADDICLYVCKKSISLCREALNEAVSALDAWSDRNGLTISESKSVVCPFNRNNRIELPHQMTLGRHEIPCDTKVRFLGLHLDRKMNWKWHINKIVEKCEKYMNVLRLICHNKWGADPSVGLLFYRATIRSIIDYGSVFYGQARKTHLQKLDTIQFKSIRLSLGYLRSTPTNILLGEACEFPLHIRRTLLAEKYIVKLRSMKSKILTKIISVTINDLTNRFWNKKVSPPLVDGFINTSIYQDKIYESCKPLPFEINYQILLSHIPIGCLPNYDLPPTLLNIQFQADVRATWPTAHLIYTDGSRIGDNVGCAFYDPLLEFSSIFKLPDEFTVFLAEIVAIYQAMKYIKSLSYDNFIIITDNKGAIVRLGNITLKETTNYLFSEILETYSQLVFSGKKVRLLWTAAHKGLEGNEKADRLAKIAVMQGERLAMKIPASDIARLVKKKAFEEWQSVYSRYQKGIFFKSIQPVCKRRPWFATTIHSRSFFVNIFRLRANHFVCGNYLHKIGLRETPLCMTCNQPDDMEHIVMECSKFGTSRTIMWEELYKIQLPTPFNYAFLLQEPSAFAAIHNFLKSTEQQRQRDNFPINSN